MTKTRLFAGLLVMAAAGVAHAGGQAASIGVGAEYQLSGIGGASVNYDAGSFHVGGFVGFADPEGRNNTILDVGGRFFYHVHSTAMSDFGVGGNLGIASYHDMVMGVDEKLTGVFVEPSVQIRLFLASNVALSATVGVVIGVADANGVALTGQSFGGELTVLGGNIGISSGAGIHYYFF